MHRGLSALKSVLLRVAVVLQPTSVSAMELVVIVASKKVRIQPTRNGANSTKKLCPRATDVLGCDYHSYKSVIFYYSLLL